MDKTEIAKETANKLSKLLISRRDVKAFEKGEWFASRKPMELADFESHLFSKNACMGTYLLNQDSQIKFVAFDIDLTGPGSYFKIDDLDEVQRKEDAGLYEGQLDPDFRMGMWDEALHDPEHDGYRWVRSTLSHVVRSLCQRVESQLALPVLPVITGGGAHVIVPFGEKVDAADGRIAAHGLMDGFSGFRRLSDNFYTNASEDAPLDTETRRPVGETISIEVFPKQDSLPNRDSFGNLLRLPFGWHKQAKMRTYIMDLSLDPAIRPWDLPKRNGMEALDEALEFFSVSSGD